MAAFIGQNGWRNEVAPPPTTSPAATGGSRLAASFSCNKRPLDDFSSQGHPTTLDGSPPKKPTYALKDFKSYHPAMAPVLDAKDFQADRPQSLNSDGSSSHTTSTFSSSSDQHLDNGYQSGLRSPSDSGSSTKSAPDFIVALYGCTGYGDSALRPSMGSGSSSSTQSSTAAAAFRVSSPPTSPSGAGGGGGGAWDSSGSMLTWDEDAETVLLAWAVVDAKLNKVVVVEDCLVRPGRDAQSPHVLSEAFRAQSGLAEEAVKSSSFTLASAVQQFQETIRTHTNGSIVLVTLGCELIRQQLLPECAQRGIVLPAYFYSFIDLLDGTAASARRSPSVVNGTESLAGLMENNRLPVTSPEICPEFGKRHAQDMGRLIQYMVHSGCDFSAAQKITQRYEPGLCKADQSLDGCVVRARGLPWQASDLDVAKFFHGLDIPRGGIALCLSTNGRRNGEAVVLFSTQQQRDLALQRHRHHMDKRYVEVYKGVAEDFQLVTGACTNEVRQFLQRDVSVIIRMRGLPYDATAQQVLDFFAAGDSPIHIVDGEAGVLFVRNRDDRATGDAFVLLGSEDDGRRAIAKHRQTLGSRYVELFRSTAAEVSQVLNHTHDRSDQQKPLIATPPHINGMISPLLTMQSPLLGVQRNCIRLRGLPFNSGVEDILDFLGDFAKHIVVQGVHMVYNAQGQASGEAFIQMDSEVAAFQTARDRHNQYINLRKYGKKDRYVEVYQCSADEMNGNGSSATAAHNQTMNAMRSVMAAPNLGGHSGGGIGLAGMNPFMTQNFGNAFAAPNPFALGLISQLSPGLALRGGLPGGGLPGMLQLPYWATPPMAPTNAFNAPVIPGLLNGGGHHPHLNPMSPPAALPSPGNFSFVHIRNLPYKATVNDIVTFLHGTGLMGPECIQLNRHSDGRPNGEAFAIFGSHEEAERAVQSRNRRSLGNRSVELSLLG
ncbi:RNA-binding protein fusilli [Hypsibius exemplaris]|uniref:RNA-binding protein fusilli n=1 Tax=Hypsibius exemplaris TaxID=2072580 RepID=A0A9X6NE52_HYPEX|nr:RNA-binding protein fusilli [Hypsibius exemplaris]